VALHAARRRRPTGAASLLRRSVVGAVEIVVENAGPVRRERNADRRRGGLPSLGGRRADVGFVECMESRPRVLLVQRIARRPRQKYRGATQPLELVAGLQVKQICTEIQHVLYLSMIR